MRGLMMDCPLLVSCLIEHAANVFSDTEIVSRTVEGPLHRYTWSDAHERTKRLAQALLALGIREGDAVATLAWNTHRHLEMYFGPPGIGAMIHTVNPRLHPTQIAYVLGHARDRAVFVDLTFLPLVEALWPSLRTVEHLVVLTSRDCMPASTVEGALCYEELLAEQDGTYTWPSFDENTAAGICYTSGTTGDPKGVVYSHRSNVLHAYGCMLPTVLPCQPGEALLPVVPMFHVNAWGVPYGAAMGGSKLVLPGPCMDGESLTGLMNEEGVNGYLGVPTVHLSLLDHWDRTGTDVPSLRWVSNGGAAPTPSLIRRYRERGIDFVHGWGMTETSPVGTMNMLRPGQDDWSEDEKTAFLMRQGRPLFGVQTRVVDMGGSPLPHDGVTSGELQVRGPWICSAYLGDDPGTALTEDGWFPTGDVAVIHPDGVVQITDRKKDLIKSGGEWISSMDLEIAASRHPDVGMAAVIGIPDEKWGERPLLIIQPVPDASPTKESILGFLQGQVAKWWLPDEIVFLETLPLGATGKVQKGRLREMYGRPAH